MSSADWKAAKEAFVARHDGSTLWDLLVISAVPPLCVGLRLRLAARGWRSLGADVCVVVAPVAFVLTVGCDVAGWVAAACLVGVACWVVEEAGLMPCPSMFTLHPVWHITMAYALVAWSAFLKYHRGMFYGFKVEIKGYWWCPYTVWSEPEEGALADSHPVVNHSRGLRSGSIDKKTGRRKDGRRNTYLAPKLQRPNLGISRFSAIAQVWRGHSFYRAEARRIGSIFVPSLGRRTSQQPDVESPRPRVLGGQKQRPGWAVV